MACAPCKQQRKLEIAEQRLGNKTYNIDENGNVVEKQDVKDKKLIKFLFKILMGIILFPILLIFTILFIIYFIINSILGKETVIDIHKWIGKVIKKNENEIVEVYE